MQIVLTIIHIVISILLILAILVQEKGGGLGEAIGGSSASASFQSSKRGAEKVMSQITVTLVILFLGLSLALNFL